MTGYSAFQSNAFQNNAFQIARNNVTPTGGGYIPQLGHPPHKKKRKGGFTWVEQQPPEPVVIVKPEMAPPVQEVVKPEPRKLHSFAELGEAFKEQATKEIAKAASAAKIEAAARKAEKSRIIAAQLADDEEVIMAYMLIN